MWSELWGETRRSSKEVRCGHNFTCLREHRKGERTSARDFYEGWKGAEDFSTEGMEDFSTKGAEDLSTRVEWIWQRRARNGFQILERRAWNVIWPCPQRRFTNKAINNYEQVLQAQFSTKFAWVKLFGFNH
jgi:hypothetical protein